jgi:hypothetical protein
MKQRQQLPKFLKASLKEGFRLPRNYAYFPRIFRVCLRLRPKSGGQAARRRVVPGRWPVTEPARRS